MEFIYTIVSVFFVNYILWRIFCAINFKNYKKIYLIIITVCEVGSSIVSIVTVIASLPLVEDNKLSYLLLGLSSALGILTGYILTLGMHLNGVKLFKTRRQRKFAKEAKSDFERKRDTIIFYSIVSLVGALLIGASITTYCLFKEFNLYFYIFIIAGALVFVYLIVFTILSLSSNKEKPVSKGKVIFFIKTDGKYFVYSDSLDGNNNIESKLGNIGIEYILSDFGVLVKNKEKIRVLGITPSEFDYSLLNGITLNKDTDDLSYILDEFNKYQRKKIVVDESNKISSIANI